MNIIIQSIFYLPYIIIFIPLLLIIWFQKKDKDVFYQKNGYYNEFQQFILTKRQEKIRRILWLAGAALTFFYIIFFYIFHYDILSLDIIILKKQFFKYSFFLILVAIFDLFFMWIVISNDHKKSEYINILYQIYREYLISFACMPTISIFIVLTYSLI